MRDENLIIKVLKFFNEMDNVGVKSSKEEYERFIWVCIRGDYYYVVGKEFYKRVRERFFDDEISLFVCNYLIWLMGKVKRWWVVLEIYEDFLEEGFEFNNLFYELVVFYFSILLGVVSKRGIWRWGVKLFNKMEDKGIKL